MFQYQSQCLFTCSLSLTSSLAYLEKWSKDRFLILQLNVPVIFATFVKEILVQT